jgi:hypothetical protein
MGVRKLLTENFISSSEGLRPQPLTNLALVSHWFAEKQNGEADQEQASGGRRRLYNRDDLPAEGL